MWGKKPDAGMPSMEPGEFDRRTRNDALSGLAAAGVVPSAIAEFEKMHLGSFNAVPIAGRGVVPVYAGDDEAFVGLELDDIISRIGELKPHWRADNEIPESVLESCFIAGNMTERGKLLRRVGADRFAQLARDWSSDPVMPKAGHKPGTQAPAPLRDAKTGKFIEGSTIPNPWLLPESDPTRTARINAFLAARPTKLSREYAAAAGCKLDGRPL